jgi:hypothetical protein
VIPASDIDRLLLSLCGVHWRKVARIIGQAYENLKSRGIAISRGIAKLMDARLAVLVGSGKLEAKGNTRRWCYGEVRLAAGRRTGQFIKPAPPHPSRCWSIQPRSAPAAMTPPWRASSRPPRNRIIVGMALM